MDAASIERLIQMEAALNAWSELGNRAELLLEQMEAAAPQLEALIRYYSSPQWQLDYQRSNRGEYPEELPQGVLSEDAVFDLLTQLYAHIQAVKALDERMKAIP